LILCLFAARVKPHLGDYTLDRAEKTYKRETVIHINREWIRRDVYTNGIEGFWSLFERGLTGQFQKVSWKHLRRYLAEFSYLFNNRDEEAQLTAHNETIQRLNEQIQEPKRTPAEEHHYALAKTALEKVGDAGKTVLRQLSLTGGLTFGQFPPIGASTWNGRPKLRVPHSIFVLRRN